ncbi:MAG: hypothetical protein IIB95_12675 [Candidatus Marinimicrobia bacterium]|nr:hypothetical protein [Candidatus Neomarinimicrobiota bacterium]
MDSSSGLDNTTVFTAHHIGNNVKIKMMDTYKVITDWKPLEQFIKDSLTSYKDDISFFHGTDETFIRSVDERPLDILRQQYTLILCELPDIILDDKYRDYAHFGNPAFFNSIIQ